MRTATGRWAPPEVGDRHLHGDELELVLIALVQPTFDQQHWILHAMRTHELVGLREDHHVDGPRHVLQRHDRPGTALLGDFALHRCDQTTDGQDRTICPVLGEQRRDRGVGLGREHMLHTVERMVDTYSPSIRVRTRAGVRLSHSSSGTCNCPDPVTGVGGVAPAEQVELSQRPVPV